MAGSQGENVTPRTPSEPTPQQIYDLMTPGEPYVSSGMAEIVREEFGDKDDVSDSKWTIKRRLNDLADEGKVEKKELVNNINAYWRPVKAADDVEE